MAFTVRVSLEGIEATEASPDPRDYSLLADQDNILIKEHSRGNVGIDDGNSEVITHDLGYPPHVFVYGELGTDGRYQLVNGYTLYSGWRMDMDEDDLTIDNRTGSNDRDARYYIFYDNID